MSCRRRNMPRRKRGQDSMDNLDQPGTSKTVSGTKRAKTLTTEPIDYARLAQEIVKIQQSTNSEVSSPSLAGENEPAKTLSKSMVQSNTQPKGSGLPETQSQLPEQSSSSQQGNESPSTIETVVSQLLSSSAGEPVGTKSMNTDNIISVTEGIPLGATVSSKIKSKVWANEFFDLRLLLSRQEEDPLMLSISPGVINVQHTLKPKTPMSINQWTDAFLIFISIRIQKNSSEAPHLLKYMSFIREMHKLYGDAAWRAYDESFRKLRESVDLAWQKPVEELRGKCIAQAIKPNYNALPFRGKQAGRVRFCFAFNRGEKCKNTPCQFSHTCQSCRGQHPQYKCTSPPQGVQENRTTNPSKTKHFK
ncbi:uncharacterized protein LOC134254963 isoform X2 [Saccostrea cucullata]|uniref:uncharacterized protein LOC134254084 n=1 Tax=Saccostrea cuccullata TaxID=36930 RepID=UPI002ED1D38F